MGFLKLHRNIQIRILTSFLTRIVGTMIFPFMAIYFSLKVGQALAGILLIINVIVSIITSFYGGYIADRIGRKIVMVVAQGVQVLAFLFMALANSPWVDSAMLTFFMMLVSSFSSGLMNPAAEAMLIDVSTPENRKLVYSLSYWSTNLSIALGSILGGLFFKSYRFELFLVISGGAFLTWIILTFFMTESYVSKTSVKNIEKKNVLKDVVLNYKTVMHDRTFITYVLASMFILSLELQMNNYVSVRLSKEFLTHSITLFNGHSFELTGIRMVSWLSTENTLLVVLLTLWLTAFTKRFKDSKVFFFGLSIYTMGYSVIGISNSMAILMTASFIATMGELLYVPVKQSFLADIAKDKARSSYMAVNGLVIQAAKLSGSIGITIGAFLPSSAMGFLYFLMGITGIYFFRKAFNQSKNVRIATEEEPINPIAASTAG